MSKVVKLTRDELIWETRCNYFGEREWIELQNYYKQVVGRQLALNIYETIKDITWDEAFAAFMRYRNKEETAEEVKVYAGTEYSQTLGNFLEEIIREDNYSSDIIDTTYADDFQEDWVIEEDEAN